MFVWSNRTYVWSAYYVVIVYSVERYVYKWVTIADGDATTTECAVPSTSKVEAENRRLVLLNRSYLHCANRYAICLDEYRDVIGRLATAAGVPSEQFRQYKYDLETWARYVAPSTEVRTNRASFRRSLAHNRQHPKPAFPFPSVPRAKAVTATVATDTSQDDHCATTNEEKEDVSSSSLPNNGLVR